MLIAQRPLIPLFPDRGQLVSPWQALAQESSPPAPTSPILTRSFFRASMNSRSCCCPPHSVINGVHLSSRQSPCQPAPCDFLGSYSSASHLATYDSCKLFPCFQELGENTSGLLHAGAVCGQSFIGLARRPTPLSQYLMPPSPRSQRFESRVRHSCIQRIERGSTDQ